MSKAISKEEQTINQHIDDLRERMKMLCEQMTFVVLKALKLDVF